MAAKPESKWTTPVVIKDCEVHCPSTCVALCFLSHENEANLVIAHGGSRGMYMKLKILTGLDQKLEGTLADMPVAITPFVNEMSASPSIAIVHGPSFMVYKLMKPYYKFKLPSHNLNPTELDYWKKAHASQNIDKLAAQLEQLGEKVSFSKLTAISQTFLMSNREDRASLVAKCNGNIKNAAPITCITSMLKTTSEPIDVVIYGTEQCDVDILDTQAYIVLNKVTLPSVPVTIRAYGTYDVDYRLFVLTRDSMIYALKRNDTEIKPIIISQSMIVSMILLNKTVVYATTDNLIHFTSFRGKKINSIKCHDKIKMLEPFYYAHKQLSAVIVVFEKEVRMYNDNYLLDVVHYEKPLSWVKFGPYGREDSTLVVCFKDGSLAIQIFRRRADFSNRIDHNPNPLAHSLKLQIPKKTKIFIDQTEREREYANKIHQVYQKNLFNLKFKIAEVYQQLTASATATVSTTTVLPLDISVDINGFGPTFRMTVNILSSSKQNLYDMHLSIISDPELYQFDAPLIPVPLLTPGQTYSFTSLLLCKDPEKASNGEIRALLVHAKRATPIVTAVIKMPFSEFPID